MSDYKKTKVMVEGLPKEFSRVVKGEKFTYYYATSRLDGKEYPCGMVLNEFDADVDQNIPEGMVVLPANENKNS